ncbi:MAG: radical SAM protein [Chloroflexi bacterium]|nr:radical SAM protein [Chloroflexota bacterium]
MKKVDIKLGYSCNNDCIHCVTQDFRETCIASGLPEDLSTEDYEKELKDSRDRGYEMIVLTGGEPTIRKDLLYLIRRARDMGFSIQMQTNGRRFADIDFVRQMLSIAPIHICIALHGHNAEIHDAISRRQGSFDQTVAGIKNMVCMGRPPSVKAVISRLNCACLPETVRFMISLGVKHISLTFPHGCGNARKYYREIVPGYSEVRPFVIEALNIILKHDISVDTEAFPFCILPGYERYAVEAYLDSERETLLKQYGDKEGEREWDKVRKEIKKKFQQCSRCKYDILCEGPWREYPEIFGEDEFCPVPGEKLTGFDALKRAPSACERKAPVFETLPLLPSC